MNASTRHARTRHDTACKVVHGMIICETGSDRCPRVAIPDPALTLQETSKKCQDDQPA
jgi:hypothetical protein